MESKAGKSALELRTSRTTPFIVRCEACNGKEHGLGERTSRRL